MKTQYKSTVLSAIVFFVFVLAAFFFTFYSSLFIEKWFNLISNLIIGVLSSAILLFLISLISYKILQKSNARHLGILISKFRNGYRDFYKILFSYKVGNAFTDIPQRRLFAIEALLSSMRETLYEIMSSEKISPLAFKTIDKLHRLMSNFTKTEFNFFEFCSRLLENLEPAYLQFHELLYINETAEPYYRIVVSKDLEKFVGLMDPNSDGIMVLEQFRDKIHQYLGLKKEKKR